MAVYAYVRCSHEKSVISGLGLEAQTNIIDCMACPDDEWGESSHNSGRLGWFVDEAVSAYKKHWAQRPAASRLLYVVRKGDVIRFARVDRAFRSVSSMVKAVEILDRRGVTMQFSDLQIDTRTPHGRAMLSMLVVWAQWESAIKSQRNREAFAARKAREGDELPKVSRKPASVSPATRDVLPAALDVIPIPKAGRPKTKTTTITQSGRVHIYIRCSSQEQADSGLGLEAQLSIATSYRDQIIETRTGLSIGEVYCDAGVSAFKMPMATRPQGKRLCESVQPGDHVVFLRLDRAFRSTTDMLLTTKFWLENAITPHFADSSMPMDFSTPQGRIFLTILSSFGELESQMTSVRIREAKEILRNRGLQYSCNCPLGFKTVKDRNKRLRVVLDFHTAALCRYCHEQLARKDGPKMPELIRRIDCMLCRRLGITPVKSTGGDYYHIKRPEYVVERPGSVKETVGGVRYRIHKPQLCKAMIHRYANQWPVLRDYIQQTRELTIRQQSSSSRLSAPACCPSSSSRRLSASPSRQEPDSSSPVRQSVPC